MHRELPAAKPETNLCPRCGQAFTCGMRAGEAVCWCVAHPPAFVVPQADAVPASGACYCPACLAALIEAKQAAMAAADGPSPDRRRA